MGFQGVVTGISNIYTGTAYVLTLLSGLLTIMVERFLYKRRGYRREALITALLGWSYICGGTLLYLLLLMLRAFA